MTQSPFIELFRTNAARVSGSKVFVHGPRPITYGELRDQVLKLTAIFGEIGLQPNDRVLLASRDDRSVITLFLALLQNGITAVFMDPDATANEARHLIPAADLSGAFADQDICAALDLGELLPTAARVVPIDPKGGGAKGLFSRFRKMDPSSGADQSYPAMLDVVTPAPDVPDDVAAETVAYILFTSGTTSKPKGVEITHANLFAQERTFVKQYGFDENVNLLNVLPLFHTDGLTHGPVLVYMVGATVFRPGRFRINMLPDMLRGIYTNRITHFIAVPSVLALVRQLGREFEDCFKTPDFKFLISTAAFLDETLWREIETLYGTMVINVYGLTETVCEALYCGPDDATRKIGTVGKPVDCEARIVDANGNEVGTGVSGELALRGDQIMKGYFRHPEANAEVLRDGWFHTGDLAVRDDAGFYRIVGRKKSVIITAGINVYPEDVTAVLRQMPAVVDAVTLGIEDETWGERVVSCVVPRNGKTITVEDVAAHCAANLSREKLPNRIYVLDDLPRGPAGKVLLDAVRERVIELEAAVETDDGAGDLDDRIYSLASRIFRMPVSDLGPDSDPDNTKNWNSLAHVEFLLEIERAFSIKITPRDIMNLKNIGDASRLVRDRMTA